MKLGKDDQSALVYVPTRKLMYYMCHTETGHIQYRVSEYVGPDLSNDLFADFDGGEFLFDEEKNDWQDMIKPVILENLQIKERDYAIEIEIIDNGEGYKPDWIRKKN